MSGALIALETSDVHRNRDIFAYGDDGQFVQVRL